MRKITSLVLCILMLATLAVPAMAADVPTFVLTADMDEVVTGDIVTITVSVAEGNTAKCSNFGVIVKYDKSKFEFVDLDSHEDQGGMKMAILADPAGTIDTNIFAGSNDGDPYPGVGAWNTDPSAGANPSQSEVAPSGKVGWVQLKCIADTTANGVVDTTSSITGIASVDGGKTSTVTPVTVKFVESKGLLGDVNDDKVVDSFDAALILIYDLDPATDFEGQYGEKFIVANANVSGAIEDGEEGIVDSFDAALILIKDLDPNYVFPAEQ